VKKKKKKKKKKQKRRTNKRKKAQDWREIVGLSKQKKPKKKN